MASWQAVYRGLIPQEYLDGLRPEDRATRYTFGPDGPTTVLAVDGERVLGFATFGPARDDDCPGMAEVYAIYAHPDAWDLGVGRALMQQVRSQLSGRFSGAVLWVLTSNERARRFYHQDGWSPDGVRRTIEYDGLTLDESRYVRDLEVSLTAGWPGGGHP